MDTATLRRMARLFAGYQRAHGRFRIIGRQANGKVEGRAVTVAGPALEPEWNEHIEGTGDGLGSIPLREDDTCYFCAIDVDIKEFPDIDPPKEARRLAELKIPAVVCRAKSGGIHVYFFFASPQPADAVRKSVHSIAASLGWGGAEIFPKQEVRSSDKDIGNWINLPYYSATKHNDFPRPALSSEGESLPLSDFLDLAEAGMIEDVTDLEIEISGELFEDGPPCLQTLASRGGFPEGTRNDGMFSAAVYAKRRWPDDWQSKLAEINGQMCKPALTSAEVVTIAKSVGRKDYHYRCKQSPIKPVCNKRLCVSRRFGVGTSGEAAGVEITSITKYPADPVIWCVEVAGHRIEMTSDQLLTHRLFTKVMAERISKLPSAVNQTKWIDYIRPKIEACDEVPPPEDADSKVQFQMYVLRWLTGGTQAQTRDELILNKPWREGGKIYFLSESLRLKLDNDRFRYESMHAVWRLLKEMGAEQGPGISLRGNKFRRPWFIPDPDVVEKANKADDHVPDEDF